MKIPEAFNDWRLFAVVLAAVIITGGIVIGLEYNPSSGIEFSMVPERVFQGNIYVGGDVSNPGIYPLFAGDSIDDVLQAAGGIQDGAELADVEIIFNVNEKDDPFIVSGVETDTPQKININRAEAWLLEALPGIGEGRAKEIIEYRRQHGFFHDIHELIEVPGLGESVFNNIKDLVSVSD